MKSASVVIRRQYQLSKIHHLDTIKIQFQGDVTANGPITNLSRMSNSPTRVNKRKAIPITSNPTWFGRFLNWIGKGSNWIGPNRSGGQLSFETDRLGEYPLGDTRVPGTYWLDWKARWHDIQYYVNRHAEKGQWVEVWTPDGSKEYYQSSGGSVFLANLGIIWHRRTRRTRPTGAVISVDDLQLIFPMKI
jgi:hypothetical protein